MKKKVLSVLLAGCIAAGMAAGCGAKDEADGYRFEVVIKSFQSTYWQAALQGVGEAEAELGVTVNASGPISESDTADQVMMLNSAIEREPDGIILAASDRDAVLDSLKEAYDRGIPVVCFDTGVPDAPEGSVYATIVTDNEYAGGIAAEKMYEAIRDYIAGTAEKVRIGVINQDVASANITGRGMGFINRMKALCEADGKRVAVIGNAFYAGQVENNINEASADVILEVAVPFQTTVELSAAEASVIMKKKDTIAVFGSNQVTAEGVLAADKELKVLAGDPEDGIVGVGVDSGSALKKAVRDGTLIGAVTQAPVDQGRIAVETLYKICEGGSVSDVTTDCYWYDAGNMDEEDIARNLYD